MSYLELVRQAEARWQKATAERKPLAASGRSANAADSLEASLEEQLRMDPETRLSVLLNLWAGSEESWPKANRNALHNDILDIFRDHPVEAHGWFQKWWTATRAEKKATGPAV